MSPVLLLVVLAVALAGALVLTALLGQRARREAAAARIETDALRERYRDVADAEAERSRVLAQLDGERAWFQEDIARARQEAEEARGRALEEVEAERARVREDLSRAQEDLEAGRAQAASEIERLRGEGGQLEQQIAVLRAEFERLDEESNLHTFGFYKPHYDFATSAAYAQRLEAIREQQREMLKAKTAAVGDVEWAVNGSKTEGRKQINQTLKLMLRAFNGECDAAVTRVRYNNVQVMVARIRKAWETINSLTQVQQCRITPEYLAVKVEELLLAHEYQEEVYEEKEEQRRIREQMREEEQAQRELDRARQEAEREEQRYEDALARARADVEKAVGAKHDRLQQQIAELEQRLAEAHARKERAIAQAQLTRSGHVYVISNVGSFGEEVFKIGMTRRLDPIERIKELGDASVPFEFDVHAVIYSEDAPGLENKLHRLFHWRRINRVNERKEFFRVGIDEIAAAVRAERAEIEIVRDAAAVEYRKTLALLADAAAPRESAVDPARVTGRYDRRGSLLPATATPSTPATISTES